MPVIDILVAEPARTIYHIRIAQDGIKTIRISEQPTGRSYQYVDIDGDGDLDSLGNRLLRTESDGSFTDLTDKLNYGTTWGGPTATFFFALGTESRNNVDVMSGLRLGVAVYDGITHARVFNSLDLGTPAKDIGPEQSNAWVPWQFPDAPHRQNWLVTGFGPSLSDVGFHDPCVVWTVRAQSESFEKVEDFCQSSHLYVDDSIFNTSELVSRNQMFTDLTLDGKLDFVFPRFQDD